MKIVKIGGTEYNLRYSLRGLFLFEQIADHPYRGTSFDMHILFFACLLEGNKNFTIELIPFIEQCESDPRLIAAFKEVMEERYAHDKALLSGTGEADDSKKK